MCVCLSTNNCVCLSMSVSVFLQPYATVCDSIKSVMCSVKCTALCTCVYIHTVCAYVRKR